MNEFLMGATRAHAYLKLLENVNTTPQTFPY
jgi:hypothetical protein